MKIKILLLSAVGKTIEVYGDLKQVFSGKNFFLCICLQVHTHKNSFVVSVEILYNSKF